MANDRYFAINNVDKMNPFFISVVSNSDHWLFISSNGGLSAGRISPESALFPYTTVDKIYDDYLTTGSRSFVRLTHHEKPVIWEPFNREQDDKYNIVRNLYKNTLGNKLKFEEINRDLNLVFRYTWMSSEAFGFVRLCELENLSTDSQQVEILDGLQNILPAGVNKFLQMSSSNLVDAYKWSEFDADSGLAIYTLYAGISDKPLPLESLRANTVFSVGLDNAKTLLSSRQLKAFRAGDAVESETAIRGQRGAHFVNSTFTLPPQASKDWLMVANVEQGQSDVQALKKSLVSNSEVLRTFITDSVDKGSQQLQKIMSRVDAFQTAAEENVTVHHYANVLFNSMRGGVFDDHYYIETADLLASIRHFNIKLFEKHQSFLTELPGKLPYFDLLSSVKQQNDQGLERLCCEYLPLTFGRRHGDPSRPWNNFSIRLKHDNNKRVLYFEGNWRDIFQNLEALLVSYPEFIEAVIAKFVSASTVDGYNPYRITKYGIDWEIEEPDDPWSYIGYWGDHQIIYLLKLLELSELYHPGTLQSLLHHRIYAYANVPYRIKPFEHLLQNAKDTIDFDFVLAQQIDQKVTEIGADGKLLLDAAGNVIQVSLAEKLLVPLLSKLSNFVIEGGIWLNTQRPEWNDANNALVGHGISMVTLYYMRRYVAFLRELFSAENDRLQVSQEVATWLEETKAVVSTAADLTQQVEISNQQRFELLEQFGLAASRYREQAYQPNALSNVADVTSNSVIALLDTVLPVIDHTIAANQRRDNMYHAYNLLQSEPQTVGVNYLYLMLEGQVAALSSGVIDPAQAIGILEAMFASDLYREDQKSFMLYPDRSVSGFLEKNCIEAHDIEQIPALKALLDQGDNTVIVQDVAGNYRFRPEMTSVECLTPHFEAWSDQIGIDEAEKLREAVLALYEQVFKHSEFTGRSGSMFAFEGLGSIYWHMVSKLLLAVQELFFKAIDQADDRAVRTRLGELYYQVREGIGFNKEPIEYGAFPTDPYSHTPKQAGAQQPGMTGQVKEEVLTRFGELGVRVKAGQIAFQPNLLRLREFVNEAKTFTYFDITDQEKTLNVAASSLVFTYCQVPVVFKLTSDREMGIFVHWKNQSEQFIEGCQLSGELSQEIFRRTGNIEKLTVYLHKDVLLSD